MAQLQFRKAMRILFVLKENNNVDFIQQFPRVTSSAILESTQEHNQRNERCLQGACMNVICIFTLGGEEACVCIVILSKLVEDGNSGEKNC